MKNSSILNPAILLAIAIFTLLALTACKSSTDNAQQPSIPQESAVNPQSNPPSDDPQILPDKTAPIDLIGANTPDFNWIYSYREQNHDKYEEAHQLIAKNIKGYQDTTYSGLHFGDDWYVITYKAPDPIPGLRDAPIPRSPAFLVDLKQNKIIQKENFNDAFILYKSVAELAKGYGNIAPDDLSKIHKFDTLLNGLATATSAVLFHHPNFVDHDYSQNTSKPSMSFDAENITFSYDITSTGMYFQITHVTVTISDHDITVTHANKQPD